jgi:hypothetical protein
MEERDGQGRFKEGNKASPGRRRAETEKQYLEATYTSVSIADWRKVVSKALVQAQKGDYQARRWLSDYLIGKPPQILELRGADALTLAQVLEAFKAQGIAPAEVFESMLAELTDASDPDSEGDEDES